MTRLVEFGFDPMWLEDFWQSFINEVRWIKDSNPSPSEEDLTAHFNDDEISTYIVVYSRFLTSCHLQLHAEVYLPFVLGLGYPSLQQFVKSDVEPMNKEADFPQCMAFASVLGISNARIEYLDNNPGPISHVDIPGDSTCDPEVVILYRPGHYDVLIPK